MFIRARENPFRSERILEVRYQPLDCTWEQMLARLAKLNYRAAIVGPQGMGKTTLLEDLAGRLQSAGFMTRSARLDEDHPRLSDASMTALIAELSPRDIILLDGCEQLPDRIWRKFLRETRPAGGLIITTHLPGRLPTLIQCRTSPVLLAQILQSLVSTECIKELDLAELLHRHRGNIRDVLRELYDRAAGLRG